MTTKVFSTPPSQSPSSRRISASWTSWAAALNCSIGNFQHNKNINNFDGEDDFAKGTSMILADAIAMNKERGHFEGKKGLAVMPFRIPSDARASRAWVVAGIRTPRRGQPQEDETDN